jgi:hypothetical protein
VKILFLTFYYPPDLSAGSFRASAVAEALLPMLPPSASLDVLTTAPNRYISYSQKVPQIEESGQLKIRRIPLPTHRSDLVGQSRAFLHFARNVREITRHHAYDLVIATSSRLMTAALGSRVAKRMGAKLYLDIRDIFVDTIGDVFPRFAWGLKPSLSVLERRTMLRADRINLVSRGFEGYFRARYPNQAYSWFTNGIDREFVEADWSDYSAPSGARPLRIVYAGNIGEGQGLHVILPGLGSLLGSRGEFRIIGDGGRKQALIGALKERGVDNVQVIAPMSRAALLKEYAQADVLFLHLNAYAAFEKVLPSKIFEYASTGKPVWAGVAGYAAKFISAEVSNAAVFAPGNANEAMRRLETLDLGFHPRLEFVRKYDRGNIAKAMAEDILTLLADRA